MTEPGTPTAAALKQPPAPQDEHNTWRPLRYFTLYRFILAGLFAVLMQTKSAPPPLGRLDPQLFYWTSLAYLAFAFGARLAIQRRYPPFQQQVYLQVLVDILAITVLMHASGGIGSGLGMLLVVSIAGGSLLTAGRTAGLFAATATLVVLIEQFYMHFHVGLSQSSYPQAGMLGATLFATAALSHTLGQRIRESEALALQRGIDLANMAQLTDYVLQHMQTGVVVVDGESRVRLANPNARKLLSLPGEHDTHPMLKTHAPELCQRLADWRLGRTPPDPLLTLGQTPQEVIPRFMAVGKDRFDAALIFLEDATAAANQAQQLKLASLGRLTASIAHEVRNPLGAISHAGELLAESNHLDPTEQRMTEIIRDQTRRVNAIIENVLRLGRRDSSTPETLPLAPWLEKFLELFSHSHRLDDGTIEVSVEPAELKVWFDPGHLQQILANLCENGLRHSTAGTLPRLRLVAGTNPEGRAWLDIYDTGPGIEPEAIPHIFEPFFTTEASGTGLGLYLSRELAQCNGAHLDYLPTAEGTSRFRLLFGESQVQQIG